MCVAKLRRFVGCVGPVGLLRGFVSFDVGLIIQKHKTPRHSIKTHKTTFPDLDEQSGIYCNCGFLDLWVCDVGLPFASV